MANSSALPFPIPSGAGDVVPLDGGIRDCGDSCTKSEGLELRKGPKTWCKGNEGTRACGDSCTKSEGLELRKGPKTWCKGNEGTRFCGSPCTKSEAAERRTTETRRRKSSTRCFLRPGTLVSRNERSRCTKCTAASSIYYAFFEATNSNRRSPRRPAAPRKSGSALVTQMKSANRRSPRLHRPSWDAHREGGALARDAVHVNRCVMDHQRVFYDGEA